MMRSGSPPILRIAVRRAQPFQTCVHVRRLDVAGDDAAAGEAAAERDAFLGRPDDHLERMARARRSPRSSASIDAERGERAEVAVEVAAARHRVDVRAEEDRRQRRRPCPARRAKMLPAGSMRGSSPAARIRSDHVLPAGDVGVRVGDAADAVGERAAGGTAEDAQRLEALPQTCRVDLRRRRLPAQRGRGDHGGGRDGLEEVPAVHAEWVSSAAARARSGDARPGRWPDCVSMN